MWHIFYSYIRPGRIVKQLLVFSNSSNESSFGTSPAKVCTDVGVLEIIELLLLPLIDDSGFVSTKLHLFEEEVLVPMKKRTLHKAFGKCSESSFFFIHCLLAIKFGWRYFPVDTSSWARLSFTFRDSKSIMFSSNETVSQSKLSIQQKKNSNPTLSCQLPSSVWLFFLLVLWSFECESDDELKLVVISSWKTPINTVLFVMHHKNKCANLFINWPLPW